MIEFRNDSHAPLMIRIVKTMCDNIYIDIEDAPREISFQEQQELVQGGYVIVEPNDFYPVEKMTDVT